MKKFRKILGLVMILTLSLIIVACDITEEKPPVIEDPIIEDPVVEDPVVEDESHLRLVDVGAEAAQQRGNLPLSVMSRRMSRSLDFKPEEKTLRFVSSEENIEEGLKQNLDLGGLGIIQPVDGALLKTSNKTDIVLYFDGLRYDDENPEEWVTVNNIVLELKVVNGDSEIIEGMERQQFQNAGFKHVNANNETIVVEIDTPNIDGDYSVQIIAVQYTRGTVNNLNVPLQETNNVVNFKHIKSDVDPSLLVVRAIPAMIEFAVEGLEAAYLEEAATVTAFRKDNRDFVELEKGANELFSTTAIGAGEYVDIFLAVEYEKFTEDFVYRRTVDIYTTRIYVPEVLTDRDYLVLYSQVDSSIVDHFSGNIDLPNYVFDFDITRVEDEHGNEIKLLEGTEVINNTDGTFEIKLYIEPTELSYFIFFYSVNGIEVSKGIRTWTEWTPLINDITYDSGVLKLNVNWNNNNFNEFYLKGISDKGKGNLSGGTTLYIESSYEFFKIDDEKLIVTITIEESDVSDFENIFLYTDTIFSFMAFRFSGLDLPTIE